MAQWILCGQHSPTRSLINQPHRRNSTVRREFFINFHQRRDQEGAEISHDINYTGTGEEVDLEDEFSEFLTPPERKTFPRATSDTPRTLHTHVPLLSRHSSLEAKVEREASIDDFVSHLTRSVSIALSSVKFQFFSEKNDETCQGWKFIPSQTSQTQMSWISQFYFILVSLRNDVTNEKVKFSWNYWLK